MELRHLRYFLAVADVLNFSRAGERLRLAQPALSRQVRALEDELGVRLFERSTAKVTLTESGHFFRQQAAKVLMRLDIAVAEAQRIAKGTVGEFRIGTTWNATALSIADAARELRERHPGLAIDFVELPAHEHTQAIRDQSIDVGFVSGNMLTPRKDIDHCLIYTCAIKAVLPKEHPRANQPEIRLDDLKQERWIALEDEEIPGVKALLTQFLRPGQFTPRFGRSARSLQGVLALVGTGEGIALLPEIRLPAESIGLRSVGTDCPPYKVFAVWSKGYACNHLPTYLEILLRKIKATTKTDPMNSLPSKNL